MSQTEGGDGKGPPGRPEAGDAMAQQGRRDREAEGRPERPRRRLRTLFLGTRALLASRRPHRTSLVVLAAVCGFIFGAGSTFTGADASSLGFIYGLGCLFVGAMCTLHAAGNLTLGLGGPGAPSRREELSLLPLGRLALPAAVYLGAATTSGMAWLAWSVTLLVCGAPCLEGGAAPPLTTLVGIGLAITALTGLLLGGLVAIGSRTSALLLGLYAFVPMMTWSLVAMGHDEVAVGLFGGLGAVELLLLALGLPFVLHALGPSAVCTARAVPTRSAAEEAVVVILAVVLCATFLAGAGLVVIGLGGALVVWSVRHLRGLPRPARRPRRATPVALGIMLALFAPLGVVAWALDVRTQSRADAGQGLVARYWPEVLLVDPTGHRAALVVEAPYAAGFTARRVAVVELAGPAAGRLTVVPARFPRLEPGSWSSDGRWLAVHDDAAGRLQRPDLGDGLALPDGAAGVVTLGLFGRLIGPTVLVDAAGEVRSVSRRALAPGWTTPEELVEVAFGLDGKVGLRRGDEAVRLGPSPCIRLAGYEGGRAVVEDLGSTPVHDRRFGTLTGKLLRWSGASFEPLAIDLQPWPVVDTEERLRIEPTSLVGSVEDGVVLALDDDGLVRVSYADGSRTLLVRDAEQILPLAGRASAFAIRTPTGWHLVVGDGAPRELVLPKGAVPRALAADGRVVVGPLPAIVEADGRATPLVP